MPIGSRKTEAQAATANLIQVSEETSRCNFSIVLNTTKGIWNLRFLNNYSTKTIAHKDLYQLVINVTKFIRKHRIPNPKLGTQGNNKKKFIMP